jgi:tetratricopeptide (TPR) repeat protein
MRKMRTPDSQAYDLVLRAVKLLHSLSYADAKKAKALLGEAIEIDPDFARPLALQGLYYVDLWQLWGEGRDSNLRRALELAKTAEELDEYQPIPYVIAAQAHQFLRDFRAAKFAADKAIALQPNDAITLATLGRYLTWAHRADESVTLLERALRLDPFHPPTYLDWVSLAYAFAGRYEDCLHAAARGIALEPDFIALHVNSAICYGALGQEEDAQRAGREILRINPRFSVGAFAGYVPFSKRSDIDWSAANLRTAGLPE